MARRKVLLVEGSDDEHVVKNLSGECVAVLGSI